MRTLVILVFMVLIEGVIGLRIVLVPRTIFVGAGCAIHFFSWHFEKKGAGYRATALASEVSIGRMAEL